MQVGLGNFDIKPENLVIANLQRADSGALAFPVFHGGDRLAAGLAEIAQAIEFGIEAPADHPGIGGERGRIFGDGLFEALLQAGEFVDFAVQGREARGGAIGEIAAEQGNAGDRLAQGDEIAGAGQAKRGAAGEALEILNGTQILADLFAQHGLGLEFGDRIEAGFDLRPGQFGAQNPGAKQARTHERDALIDGAE